MKADIAIVIEPQGDTTGLLQTLESICRQNTQYNIEVLVNVKVDNQTTTPLVEDILANNPWLYSTRAVHLDQVDSQKSFLALSNADYFAFLNCRDELLPGALDALLQSAKRQNSLATLGWLKWTNGNFTWSHSLISAPNFSSNLHLNSDEFKAAVGNAFFSIYNREYYERGWGKAEHSVHVIHEYICQKFCDRKPDDQSLYIARDDSVRATEGLKATPLPQAGIKPQKKQKSGIWLFGERAGSAAEDNAFALFEHCTKTRPEIDAYYVLNQDVPDLAVFPYQEKLLIKGTTEYEVKRRMASHFVFTDSAFDILEPDDLVLDYMQVNHIYLTHGYLAYSPGVYQRSLQYIDSVICTSQEDIAAAKRAWGFPVSKFQCCGLARWDKLNSVSTTPREILLCPTWRKSLNSSFWKSEYGPSDEDLENFQQGDYFQAISSLLKSRELQETLARHNLRLIIKLHFRLEQYLALFRDLESDLIQVADSNCANNTLSSLLQRAALLITDYSSIMWDMAYMEKPVICYQFDKAAMLAERLKNSFSLSDNTLPFMVAYGQHEALSALDSYASRSFKLEERELTLIDRYIPQRNGGACDRTLDFLTGTYDLEGQHHQARPADCSIPQHSLSPGIQSLHANKPGSKVAVISGFSYEGCGEADILSPKDWQSEIAEKGYSELIVEPHANGNSAWADIFFSPGATRELLEQIAEYTQNYATAVTPSLPNFLPYRDTLAPLPHYFSKMLSQTLPQTVNNTCEISVIVPVYNGEKHISRCLESIFAQSIHQPFEIIVINDGSIDSTSSILKDLLTLHPNLTVLTQENARQGMARNRGLLAAKGRYVTFVDADDALHPEALAELWHCAQLHGTKVAAGLLASCHSDGINQWVHQSFFHYTKAPSVINASNWPQVFFDPSSVAKLYEKEFLLSHNIFFPQSFHEDQAFCFHLYATGEPIAITRKVIYFYIARPEDDLKSGTQTFSSEKLQHILLAGKLSVSHVQVSSLEPHVKDTALGFLVMRYDRFIWKLAQQETLVNTQAILDSVWSKLHHFFSNVADSVILDQARHHASYFLMAKRNNQQAARAALTGDIRPAISVLELENALMPKVLDALNSGKNLASTYNYYKPVRLTNTLDKHDLVTEESYGYRLGDIFISAFKHPPTIIYIPFRLLFLIFDMLTRRGREKELMARQRLLQNSEQALANHSGFVKSTAAYQLGVALLEAATNSPGGLLKLPARIKSIYRRTKPAR